MNILGVIPSRYGSTRFPGKPLADIKGKSMVQRVYEQALKSGKLNWLVVATDDKRIYDHVKGFGGEVMMTSADHSNGTSRVLEAVEKFESSRNISFDAVINIQGDEPFIEPSQIDSLCSLFDDENAEIVTMCKRINDVVQLESKDTVKVVKDLFDYAIYFSRSVIPFARGVDNPMNEIEYFKHLGIYGYRKNVLKEIVKLKETPLERSEKLEQLRWLENGYKIKLVETSHESLSVDTPEDLKIILKTIDIID